MQRSNPKKKVFPAQSQRKPGLEYKMRPEPQYDDGRPGNNKLKGKVCIITGADSGIGRAVAIAFAKEGADIGIIYLSEDKDAEKTASIITERFKSECLLVRADISRESNCVKAVARIKKHFGKVDVLVNNAAVHYPVENLEELDSKNMQHTFAVNVFAMFWVTKAVLPLMRGGAAIINTSSVTAYRGSGGLLDYSSTKGAIVSFTRSLAANLAGRKIRVNGVAPGPIWTPLIPSSFDKKKVSTYGTETPMKRAGQPSEVAPCFVFLASDDSSYISGQFLHPNGGEIING